MNENNLDSPTQSSASEPATGNDAAYRVLARKYRPQEFSELVGQDALVTTITNAIREDRIAHAFILTGVRGVGKTTTARIIARSLNCIGADGQGGPTVTPCGVCEHCRAIADSRHVDVLEMDAASRTGVDNMRELLDSVRYLPASARFKIYIIDEVHMLSIAAFNALLKTLEEPPEDTYILLASCHAGRLLPTIRSRCQRFVVRPDAGGAGRLLAPDPGRSVGGQGAECRWHRGGWQSSDIRFAGGAADRDRVGFDSGEIDGAAVHGHASRARGLREVERSGLVASLVVGSNDQVVVAGGCVKRQTVGWNRVATDKVHDQLVVI